MTTKTKIRNRILEAVRETAADLHRLGFIDKRKMRKYDALCLDPVQDYDAEKVKALRERLHLSQAVLASVLNTSLSTVRKWEVGDKRPSGPSQRLLDIIERKGLEAVLESIPAAGSNHRTWRTEAVRQASRPPQGNRAQIKIKLATNSSPPTHTTSCCSTSQPRQARATVRGTGFWPLR
jgi:putative transcriptional regulator